MTALARPTVRLLGGEPSGRGSNRADWAAMAALLSTQPVHNCVLAGRINTVGSLRPDRLGGQLWGVEAAGVLRAACYVGGTVIPVGTDSAALRLLGPELARLARPCSSIVGPAEQVEVLWRELAASWGPARLIRPNQPLLISGALEPSVAAQSSGLRLAQPDDVSALLPAAVAMFVEELGISPLSRPGEQAFRGRLNELVASGRVYVVTDSAGRVVFKAEIAAMTAEVAQIQGVWVLPEERGRGLGTAAMAAMLADMSRRTAKVSLYVNDFNTPARAMYRRLGMTQIDTFETILF